MAPPSSMGGKKNEEIIEESGETFHSEVGTHYTLVSLSKTELLCVVRK